MKVHWTAFRSYQLEALPRLDESHRRLFERLVFGSKFIFLRRRDKLRQAISDWRASSSRVYQLRSSDEGDRKSAHAAPLSYDYGTLKTRLRMLLGDELGWQEFFSQHRVEPLEVWYEDLCSNREEVLKRVLSHLGLEPPGQKLAAETLRLSDDFSESIYERFRAELSTEFGSELAAELSKGPIIRAEPRVQLESRPRKRAVLVTLAAGDSLERARQLFAGAFLKGCWDGDYLLLTEEVLASELDWFRERGILVRQQVEACRASLFTDYFKGWDLVVYCDPDALVIGPLQGLHSVQGFAAVEDRRDCLEELTALELSGEYEPWRRPFDSNFFAFSTDCISEPNQRELMALRADWPRDENLVLNLHFYDRWRRLEAGFNVQVDQLESESLLDRSLHEETRWDGPWGFGLACSGSPALNLGAPLVPTIWPGWPRD